MPCQSSCNDKSLLRLSIVAAFFLQYDSLKKLVVPVLEEENVVAVGGTVRPSNDVELRDGKVVKYRLPKNILACMQLLEYDRSFLASRILFDRFTGILTLTAFFSRIQTIDLTVKPKDCFKAIMLDWGRIERKKMNI